MKEIVGSLVSIQTSESRDLRSVVTAELDGLVGDKHQGFERVACSWDRDPTGTIRRNERQWSGVSFEELERIRERMDLTEPLTAGDLSTNLCVRDVPFFSQLPEGSRLVFPSGAALLVEEGNPPCAGMGARIAAAHTTRAGAPVAGKLFPRHALGLRGVVGIVDVPGTIAPGDRVVVQIYEEPAS